MKKMMLVLMFSLVLGVLGGCEKEVLPEETFCWRCDYLSDNESFIKKEYLFNKTEKFISDYKDNFYHSDRILDGLKQAKTIKLVKISCDVPREEYLTP